MTPVEVRRGTSPVVLGFPHTGTFVPEEFWQKLNAEGRLLRDTDWHVDRLYDGLLPEATTVRATAHRYVVDANRDPSGKSLYPGRNTTGLAPLTDFDNRPIWQDGAEPGESGTAWRVALFHRPYHDALAVEIARVKAAHGIAVVYDCHSIRSSCPFLFEGRLPDFNIGTDNGRACANAFEQAAVEICAAAQGYTSVLNGRFRGGWTTRHHGDPQNGVHAIQMELAQATYLETEEPPFHYSQAKAQALRAHLKDILARIEAIAFSMARKGR